MMEKYYRITIREGEEDGHWFMPLVLTFILGLTLLWNQGWRYFVFASGYTLFMLLFNLKIEVRKLRSKK